MPITFDCAALSCPWFPPDTTLLEIATANQIPTVSACGGNGICSTCRVEVIEGLDQLAPPSEAEQTLALKRGWPANVRLACTARVVGHGPVTVRRLITPPEEKRRQRRLEKQGGLGQIRSLAVLFADMRNFTAITEACPAFDVVYILNRYFTTLKQAITKHGGQVNLYVGDEISAVFGMDTDPRIACRQAVDAGLEMLQRIETLSAVMEREFHVRLAIGVGIHHGPVIVGKVGPVDDLRFGLVGDTVNIASRLESQTKELGVPLLASAAVVDHLSANQDFAISAGRQVAVKGIQESLLVHAITPSADAPGLAEGRPQA
ncbi:MAG: adenylate/guanylate cyclase domain-containing protein [Cyanobium sp. M30B3]|nr:MAG: adenylate/guanylate cyclase domain-containing protein [Cyanobium sp. M30B3]